MSEAGGERIINVNNEYTRHLFILRKEVSLNDHNTTEENEQFITAVLNDTPVVTDGREGAKTVAVCRAVVESCDKGLPVKIEYDF